MILLLAAALAQPATAPELIALGWDRVEDGDYEGARIVAESALKRDDVGLEEEALYLLAFALEWGGEPERALGMYDRLLADFPQGERTLDTRFRRAETLALLGRHDDARDALAPFDDVQLPAEDRRKVELLEGIWLIEEGRTRKGLRKLTLLEEDVGTAPWHEAQARASQIDVLVDGSERLHLDVGMRKQRRRLATRAAHLAAIEPLIERTIELEQTHWILYELLAVGRAYETVGDHLLSAREPRLTEAQRTLYRDELSQRVDIVWTKALKWYQLGLDHTTRVDFRGALRDDLISARRRVEVKLDHP